MVDIIIYCFAFLVTVPFFSTWIVYFISRRVQKQKRKAIHRAVNWTTFLYICGFCALLYAVSSLVYRMAASHIIRYYGGNYHYSVENGDRGSLRQGF